MSDFECAHCGETYPDSNETKYLSHLTETHEQELTRVDKRHIEQSDTVSLSDTANQAALVVQTAILILILGLVVLGAQIVLGL